jgi:hypothetical protein
MPNANPHNNPQSNYLPEDINALAAANRPRATPENANYAAYGKEIVNNALMGLAATGSAAALYHLINGFGTAKIPALVRNPSPEATTEGNKKPAKSRKKSPASSAVFKFASANDLLQKLYESIGRIPPQTLIPTPSVGGGGPGEANVGPGHSAWRTAFNLAAGIGGGAAGIGLVNSIAGNKRKEDLNDQVESARQEYFDALSGKAAALDTAYDNVKTAEGVNDYLPWNWNFAGNPGNPNHMASVPRTIGAATSEAGKNVSDTVAKALLLTTLGTGAIGAKYMYDQTKARTQAENLRKAQASRARLRGLQQTPWIDPDELAAMSRR